MTNKDESQLQNFVVLTWQPNPRRHVVRFWIDDGAYHSAMSNERFLGIVEPILMESLDSETYQNIKKIEWSLDQYQGFYQYDREKDTFRELQQIRMADPFTPKDVYEGACLTGLKTPTRVDGIDPAILSTTEEIKKQRRESSPIGVGARFFGAQ